MGFQSRAAVDRAINELKRRLGEDRVITDPEMLEPYSHDELPDLSSMPDAVVRPSSASEVSQILGIANLEGVPVTPRGLGVGLTGGAVPVLGGIVLSLEDMGAILDIDEKNLVAVVEPGVVVETLHKAVEERGLFYPPDPASLESCSIGGNIAENAGGPRAFKYGVTRHYVLGLEVVLSDGGIIRYGGKMIKNVSGYSLVHQFIGCEGTLGVITQATLRLIPLPQYRVDLLVPFESVTAAAGAITEIALTRRYIPCVAEVTEGEGMRIAGEVLEVDIPFPGAGAHVIITLDGDDEAQIDRMVDEVGEVCMSRGAPDVLVAQNAQTRERIWNPRRKLIDVLKAVSDTVDFQDVSVPRQLLPELVAGVRSISDKHGIPALSWGHAGDGNVHVAIMKRNVEDAVWEKGRHDFVGDLLNLTVELGGAIAGEHGIGFVKKPFLRNALGERELDVMKRIKGALDPRGTLNPGKIF